MGVWNNHYNYQIAVIFAILIGGCLLLGGTVAAIYFVCVNNMREDKKKLTARSPSSTWQQQQPYKPAEPIGQGQFIAPQPPTTSYTPTGGYPPQQGYGGQQQGYNQQGYPQQYDIAYNRSAVPSPQQPQNNFDPYRPSPYDDTRMVQMQQPVSYHQSSV